MQKTRCMWAHRVLYTAHIHLQKQRSVSISKEALRHLDHRASRQSTDTPEVCPAEFQSSRGEDAKIRRLGVWNTPGLWHKDRKYPYVRLSRKPRLVGRNKASQGEWTHPKYAVRDRRVQEEKKRRPSVVWYTGSRIQHSCRRSAPR